MTTRPLTSTLLTLALSMAIPGTALAIADADNLGQWDKPTNIGPDKEVPGFLVNLGPTGARAILKETSFVVKHVFAGSPAEGKLRIDDEITGANGKPFSKHTFGKFYGMEPGAGYEGPVMDMGNAIEDSEGNDGTLTLDVIRDGKPAKVEIKLDPIGRFSDTFPKHCQKSEKLAARAMDYLLQHPEERVGDVHEKGLYGLALLAQWENQGGGNPGHGMERSCRARNSGPGIRPTNPSSSPNTTSRPATSACSDHRRSSANASTSPR